MILSEFAVRSLIHRSNMVHIIFLPNLEHDSVETLSEPTDLLLFTLKLDETGFTATLISYLLLKVYLLREQGLDWRFLNGLIVIRDTRHFIDMYLRGYWLVSFVDHDFHAGIIVI